MQAKLCAHSVNFGREASNLKNFSICIHFIDAKSVWLRNKYDILISVLWDVKPCSQLFTDVSEESAASFRVVDRASRFLQKGRYLLDYVACH
jgi:hypothetical protein